MRAHVLLTLFFFGISSLTYFEGSCLIYVIFCISSLTYFEGSCLIYVILFHIFFNLFWGVKSHLRYFVSYLLWPTLRAHVLFTLFRFISSLTYFEVVCLIDVILFHDLFYVRWGLMSYLRYLFHDFFNILWKLKSYLRYVTSYFL